MTPAQTLEHINDLIDEIHEAAAEHGVDASTTVSLHAGGIEFARALGVKPGPWFPHDTNFRSYDLTDCDHGSVHVVERKGEE